VGPRPAQRDTIVAVLTAYDADARRRAARPGDVDFQGTLMARDTVEIWSYSEGQTKLIGRVRLVDGRIRFQGLNRKQVAIMHDGIAGIEQRLVFPSEGQAFLDALPIEFSGYLRARFVEGSAL